MAHREAADGKRPADDYLVIGRVVAPHGVRGEVRVAVETDDPERFAGLETVYVGDAKRELRVVGVRAHQDRMLLLFAGIEDRNAAEALRGQLLYVAVDEVEPLEDGAYYYHEVEGLEVVDEHGARIGILREVLPTGANDVYVVKRPAGELLIPAIHGVVLSIEPERGRVVVRIPPGLDPQR